MVLRIARRSRRAIVAGGLLAEGKGFIRRELGGDDDWLILRSPQPGEVGRSVGNSLELDALEEQ